MTDKQKSSRRAEKLTPNKRKIILETFPGLQELEEGELEKIYRTPLKDLSDELKAEVTAGITRPLREILDTPVSEVLKARGIKGDELDKYLAHYEKTRLGGGGTISTRQLHRYKRPTVSESGEKITVEPGSEEDIRSLERDAIKTRIKLRKGIDHYPIVSLDLYEKLSDEEFVRPRVEKFLEQMIRHGFVDPKNFFGSIRSIRFSETGGGGCRLLAHIPVQEGTADTREPKPCFRESKENIAITAKFDSAGNITELMQVRRDEGKKIDAPFDAYLRIVPPFEVKEGSEKRIPTKPKERVPTKPYYYRNTQLNRRFEPKEGLVRDEEVKQIGESIIEASPKERRFAGRAETSQAGDDKMTVYEIRGPGMLDRVGLLSSKEGDVKDILNYSEVPCVQASVCGLPFGIQNEVGYTGIRPMRPVDDRIKELSVEENLSESMIREALDDVVENYPGVEEVRKVGNEAIRGGILRETKRQLLKYDPHVISGVIRVKEGLNAIGGETRRDRVINLVTFMMKNLDNGYASKFHDIAEEVVDLPYSKIFRASALIVGSGITARRSDTLVDLPKFLTNYIKLSDRPEFRDGSLSKTVLNGMREELEKISQTISEMAKPKPMEYETGYDEGNGVLKGIIETDLNDILGQRSDLREMMPPLLARLVNGVCQNRRRPDFLLNPAEKWITDKEGEVGGMEKEFFQPFVDRFLSSSLLGRDIVREAPSGMGRPDISCGDVPIELKVRETPVKELRDKIDSGKIPMTQQTAEYIKTTGGCGILCVLAVKKPGEAADRKSDLRDNVFVTNVGTPEKPLNMVTVIFDCRYGQPSRMR